MKQLTLVIGNKNYSSWSLRPWLAMKQAGLDFNEVRIALYTPTAPQEIRQYSPAGKVPNTTRQSTGGQTIKQHGQLLVPLVRKCIQASKLCVKICQ